MKIELREVPVRDLIAGYKDSEDTGVIGLNGKLNIRPKYQREFVYKDKQREAVIDTVRKEFPLNVMYWVDNQDGTYEVLDGQQRTISICQYATGKYAVNFRFWHNLTEEEKQQILDYKLMIYVCTGSDIEKLEWFKTINIAGEKLLPQELRNAVYTGPWLTDAKKYFSKNECAAYSLAKDYLKGAAIRQDYLQVVINWISNGNIETYMATNQNKPHATELWSYFQNVISWVTTIFTEYRKEMKGIAWGDLYNMCHKNEYNPLDIESLVSRLMMDEDVTNKAGIYVYALTGEEKYLNIRAFSDRMKREVYETQGGVCPHCSGKFDIADMEADHIIPWSNGGKTDKENCQVLCKPCNRKKSDN